MVEVAPLAKPPVCRLMDFGKYLYEQRKRQRETKKAQTGSVIKEVKISAKIEEHDLAFKLAFIKKFLARRYRVKVTVVFRGREITHPELGAKVIQKIIASLNGLANVESEPKLEGRTMSTLLTPQKKGPGNPKIKTTTTENGSYAQNEN